MISLLLLAALAAPHPLNEAWQPPIKRWQARGVSVHGRLATIGVYYNDADFDEAPRYLDPSGPSVGQIATFFRPGVTLTPQEGTQIYYQAELGWSVWSQRDAEAEGLDAYHREIWAQQRLDDWGALRVGYQRIEDPSGLFLNHRAGAARLTYTYQGGELALLGGVTPDDTAEGLGEDNFEHDSAVGGLALQHTAGGLLLDLAGYGLWDHHIVDRPLTLGVLVLGLRRADGALWAHAVLQRGEWAGAALGGGAQRLAAWAAQAGGALELGRLSIVINGLLSAPDDDHDGNDLNAAPLLSGRDASSTLLLTEDEYGDRRQDVSARMSARLGAFTTQRAGRAVADLALGYAFEGDYVMRLIGGAAMVLSPRHALDQRLIGVELGWIHELYFNPTTGAYLMGQLLLPGGAAAAYLNEVNAAATQPLYGGQLGLVTHF